MERKLHSSIGSVLQQHQFAINRELISPINKLLMENQRLMQNTVRSSLQGIIGQQESLAKQLAQLPLRSIAEQLKLNNPSFSQFNSVSKFSAFPAYHAVVENLEGLYEDVVHKEHEVHLTDDTEFVEVKDFIEELLVYCKKIGSVINTLNSPVLWDLLQKVATIYTIYIAVVGGSSCAEPHKVNNHELIDEHEQPADNIKYEQDRPKEEMDIKPMNIDTGIRT